MFRWYKNFIEKDSSIENIRLVIFKKKTMTEDASKRRLPTIFKMSMLWNILPYYEHIHRWRSLLEKINTETKNKIK